MESLPSSLSFLPLISTQKKGHTCVWLFVVITYFLKSDRARAWPQGRRLVPRGVHSCNKLQPGNELCTHLQLVRNILLLFIMCVKHGCTMGWFAVMNVTHDNRGEEKGKGRLLAQTAAVIHLRLYHRTYRIPPTVPTVHVRVRIPISRINPSRRIPPPASHAILNTP